MDDQNEEQDHPFELAFNENSDQFPHTYFGEGLNEEGSQWLLAATSEINSVKTIPGVNISFQHSDSQDSDNEIISDEDTVDNLDSDSTNCLQVHQKQRTASTSSLQEHPVSSLLELYDVAKNIYRISAVAFKSAPLMMTYFEHNPLTILLDTGAENNIIGT